MRCINLSVRQLFKNNGGFFYIDALIGIVILTVALTFMAGTYRQAIANSVFTDQNTIATSLARQTLEELKDQDNIQQLILNTPNFTLPTPTTTLQNGVTYTSTVTKVDIGADTLGRLTNEITPAQVTVTWRARPTDAADTTLTMFGYYSVKTLFDYTKPLTKPSPKTRFAIYDMHGDSSKGAMQHANSPNNGYFYTIKSKVKKLWVQNYEDRFPELEAIIYEANKITIQNPENRAATNNWGASGDILQFDNLTIPSSDPGYCDVFSFQVENDGPSYAEYQNPNYIDRAQWGLPSNYKNFTFDIYLSSTYDADMTKSTKNNPTKYLLVSNAEAVASDKESNGLKAGKGQTYPLTLPDPTPGKEKQFITVTATVIAGAVQIIGLPAGSTYSIGLQWKIDAGNSDTNLKSGTDGNTLISNLSLQKGKIIK